MTVSRFNWNIVSYNARPNPLVRKNEKWPLLLHLFQESQFEEQLSQHTFKRNWVIILLHDP